MLLVRADERPSPSAFDALVATGLLVTLLELDFAIADLTSFPTLRRRRFGCASPRATPWCAGLRPDLRTCLMGRWPAGANHLHRSQRRGVTIVYPPGCAGATRHAVRLWPRRDLLAVV